MLSPRHDDDDDDDEREREIKSLIMSCLYHKLLILHSLHIMIVIIILVSFSSLLRTNSSHINPRCSDCFSFFGHTFWRPITSSTMNYDLCLKFLFGAYSFVKVDVNGVWGRI